MLRRWNLAKMGAYLRLSELLLHSARAGARLGPGRRMILCGGLRASNAASRAAMRSWRRAHGAELSKDREASLRERRWWG